MAGRLLEEALVELMVELMVEHMVEHMVELMVVLMVVAINECLRILFPFPTTKRRTSGVTVSRLANSKKWGGNKDERIRLFKSLLYSG